MYCVLRGVRARPRLVGRASARRGAQSRASRRRVRHPLYGIRRRRAAQRAALMGALRGPRRARGCPQDRDRRQSHRRHGRRPDRGARRPVHPDLGGRGDRRHARSRAPGFGLCFGDWRHGASRRPGSRAAMGVRAHPVQPARDRRGLRSRRGARLRRVRHRSADAPRARRARLPRIACSDEDWRQAVAALSERAAATGTRTALSIYPWDIVTEIETRLESPQAMLLVVPNGKVKLLNALPFAPADLRRDSLETAWDAYREAWRGPDVRAFVRRCRNEPALLRHANETWAMTAGANA